MDNRSQFPVRLKMLRKEFGYSSKEFAEWLGIKLQSYYGYERGRATPSFDVLIRIAEKCNVSLDWLCGITPESDFKIQKGEINTILSQLMEANEMGKAIQVTISCR